MKKGDIVKLKRPTVTSLQWSAHSWNAYEYAESVTSVPELFTVKEMADAYFCGMSSPVVSFEEIPGYFIQRNFDIELQAGEPDITELTKETREPAFWESFLPEPELINA